MIDAGSTIPISASLQRSEKKERESSAAGIFGALFCDSMDEGSPLALRQPLATASGEPGKMDGLSGEGDRPVSKAGSGSLPCGNAGEGIPMLLRQAFLSESGNAGKSAGVSAQGNGVESQAEGSPLRLTMEGESPATAVSIAQVTSAAKDGMHELPRPASGKTIDLPVAGEGDDPELQANGPPSRLTGEEKSPVSAVSVASVSSSGKNGIPKLLRPVSSPPAGKGGKTADLPIEVGGKGPVSQADGPPLLLKTEGEHPSASFFGALVSGFAKDGLSVLPRPASGKTSKTVELAVEGFGERPAHQSAAPVPPPKAVAEALPQPALADEKAVRLEHLKESFDQRMLSMMQRGEKVTRITVEPAALGRVTVVCREENSSMTVEILAQSQPVRELLATQEDAVRRLMESHSFSLGSFDVLLDQETNERRRFGSDSKARFPAARGTGPAIEEEGELHALPSRHKCGAVSLIA